MQTKLKTSYNIFAGDVFTLLSKKEKLSLLKDRYDWGPKSTKERTQEHLDLELRKRVNVDYDVAIVVRDNKTGQYFEVDTMGILEKWQKEV